MKRLWLLLAATAIFSLPAFGRIHRNPDRITDEYLVKLDDATPDTVATAHGLSLAAGGRVLHVWGRVFKGFHIALPEPAAEWLSQQPGVQVVEENSHVYTSSDTQTTDGSLWNLDRLDQRTGTDGTYTYGKTGAAVRIYVVDTGVMASHDQFLAGLGQEGYGTTRVEQGYSVVTDGYAADNPCTESTENPYAWGHGTSVASVAAGRTYGVAKYARIVPVRVLNCGAQGTLADVITGLNWIFDDYDSYLYPAVVNMSIFFRVGGTNNATWNQGAVAPPDATLLDNAVATLVSYGITVVVSANNQNVDASWTSPARASDAITVGGSALNGTQDSRWLTANPTWSPTPPVNLDPGSNWGSSVTIFAPAANIRSAHVTSNTAYRTAYTSGTSFAAPFVTGVVARVLQGLSKTSYNPSIARQYLLNNANTNVLASTPALNGSPNLLTYADPNL